MTAWRVEGGFPFKNTVLYCLTNRSGGYIPTSSAYDEGGYEAKSSPLKPGTDDIIVEGMTKFLIAMK